MTNPQLLIDGDLYAYTASTVAEYEAEWDDDIIVLSTNLEEARDNFARKIDGFKAKLWSDDVVIVFSGSKNFRYGLTSTYKSNRVSRKPLGYRSLVDWVSANYTTVSKECLEADDYLGILATKPGGVPRIIVSEDKDMKTIPASVYRMGELIEVSEDEADEFWMMQTLMGDRTDGYLGCPGIGPVTAAKIVKKPGTRWENVRQTFLKNGLTEEDALLQARLSRILRWEDWDPKNQRPILWQPRNT